MYLADDIEPTRTSPARNAPLFRDTLSSTGGLEGLISVLFLKSLTLALTPEVSPLTISLNINVPIPVVLIPANVTVGATVYPAPVFEKRTPEIEPSLMTVLALAVVPPAPVAPVNVMIGSIA